jgi:KUP system potassium uptake protein
MGHFGRPPITRAWFWLVFPALVLSYLGQGALLSTAHGVTNPFFMQFPEVTRVGIVVLAALATFIASQSVISGAFSLTRQAVQLGFLPRMLIRHTSNHEIGQVYIPFVNAVLLIAVTLFVVGFGSAEKLASAYGIAVSGTLLIDSILFIAVTYLVRAKRFSISLLAVVLFVLVDLLFVTSSVHKILHGGWIPMAIAAVLFTIIYTWWSGQQIIIKERKAIEGPLQDYIDEIRSQKPPLTRVPGQAVYVGHHAGYAPLALHAAVEELHELHEKVVVLSVKITTHPHVSEDERYEFDDLGYNDGISHLSLTYGYHDVPNIPKTLESLRSVSPELDFDPEGVAYFISQTKVVATGRHNMSRWRKSLYMLMARNAMSSSDYYRLPIERTIEMRSLIKL